MALTQSVTAGVQAFCTRSVHVEVTFCEDQNFECQKLALKSYLSWQNQLGRRSYYSWFIRVTKTFDIFDILFLLPDSVLVSIGCVHFEYIRECVVRAHTYGRIAGLLFSG